VFSKLEAFLDVIMEVNHKDHKVLIGMESLICKRGQSLNSLDTWALRWRWSKSKVKRFFDLIQDRGMIRIENVRKTTRLTVCNYETYQAVRNADETETKRKRHGHDPQTNNDNNENNEKEEDSLTLFSEEPKVGTQESKKLEFEEALKFYPGVKRKLDTEFENFVKKYPLWREIVSHLKPAIENQLAWRQTTADEFIPEWKHFRTWINQKCWEEEHGIVQSVNEDLVREEAEEVEAMLNRIQR